MPEILGVRKLDAIVIPGIVLAGNLFHLSKFDPRSSQPPTIDWEPLVNVDKKNYGKSP